MSSSSESEEQFQGEQEQQHTKPCKAGALRKGDYIVIKGFPCKIVEVTTSKTGKHGHAKAHITALDIFTNRKYEDHQPSSHNVEVPFVDKNEYDLIDIKEDGGITYLQEDGEYNETLSLNTESELFQKIFESFENGDQLMISVTSAMGNDHVTDFRKDTSA